MLLPRPQRPLVTEPSGQECPVRATTCQVCVTDSLNSCQATEECIGMSSHYPVLLTSHYPVLLASFCWLSFLSVVHLKFTFCKYCNLANYFHPFFNTCVIRSLLTTHTIIKCVCVCVCSCPSRAVSAAEASRRGGVEDLLLSAGAGPVPGGLRVQEIQPASQRPHPLVRVT